MKVIFFVVFPEINAGTRYRVCKYLPYLDKENIQYTVCPPMPNWLFKFLYQTGNPIKKVLYYLISFEIRFFQLLKVFNYDIIFIHQGLSYFGPPFLEKLMAAMNKTIIFDTDDAHFVKPKFATGMAARFHDRKRTAKLSKMAHHVIVSVDYLKKYVEQYNANVTIIPTSIDLQTYILKSYQKEPGAKVVIGWAGTASGLIYLKGLESVFQRLAQRFDFQLKIICSTFLSIAGVDVRRCIWSLKNEVSDLQSLDIGIMPLANTEFERGKGGFKLIQYMGVGVPVVCSPVGVNSEIVQDGINGFWAETENEWVDKLTLLIENEEMREKVGKKGRESIQDKFTIEGNASKLVQVIKSHIH